MLSTAGHDINDQISRFVYSSACDAYVGRNTALAANGTTLIGYGFQGSGRGQNKTTQEGAFGWTHTWWRDGKYGAFQTMLQYAYFFRDPWFVNRAAALPRTRVKTRSGSTFATCFRGTAPSIKY